jgi:thioredoxin-related protein
MLSNQQTYFSGNWNTPMKLVLKNVFLVLIVATASWLPMAQAASLPTVTDFTIEAKAAQEKQVPILILFMSDTCHYCETVLNDFLLPMHRDPAFANKVILRQIETSSKDELIDFDGVSTSHRAFSSKNEAWAVPVVMLFDSHGQVLTSIVGLLTVDFYYFYLENAINESLEKIRTAAHP